MLLEGSLKKILYPLLLYYIALPIFVCDDKSANVSELISEKLETATCEEGFYRWFNEEDKHLECKPCDCNSKGTRTCDSLSGKCVCFDHVIGVRCDRCANSYYGLNNSDKGCRPCNCYSLGSRGRDCDQETGQCACNRGFRQRACDECEISHYRLVGSSSLVCAPCNCHPSMSRIFDVQSENQVLLDLRCNNTIGIWKEHCQMNTANLRRHCDLVTGQCPCLDQSTGRACDKCAPRHVPSPGMDGGGLICEACNSCSTSLMDLLDDVDRDLSYANSTVDKRRLSATLGHRLGELELALGDHSAGLKSSEDLFYNSLASINRHASKIPASSTNNTGDNLEHLIARLELDSSILEFEFRRFANISESDLQENLRLMMKNISQVDLQFQFQLNLILAINEELQQIECNYQQEDTVDLWNTNNNQKLVNGKLRDLIIVDNRYAKRLIKKSKEMLKNQSTDSLELGETISELTIYIQRLDNIINHQTRISSDYSKFIALNVVLNPMATLNQLDDLKFTIESTLETLTSDLARSLEDSRELNQQLNNNRHQFDEMSAKNLSIELNSIHNLNLKLRESQRRLNLTTDRFNIESESLRMLLGQTGDLHSLNISLSSLKDLTIELATRTSKLTLDDAGYSKLKAKEVELSKHSHSLSNDYRAKTSVGMASVDLASLLDFASIINEILDNLNAVNDFTRDTDKTMASSIDLSLLSGEPYPVSDDQSAPHSLLNETKSLQSSVLGELDSRLTLMRNLYTSMSIEIDMSTLSIGHITEGLKILNNATNLNSDLILNLEPLISETSNLTSVVGAKTSRVMEVMENLTSKWNELSNNPADLDSTGVGYNFYANNVKERKFSSFLIRDRRLNKSSSSSSLDEQNYEDEILSSPSGTGLMLLAKRQFERLRKIVTDDFDHVKITNLSNLASVGMRQSIEGLRKKIDYVRLLVNNQVNLGREFGHQRQPRQHQDSRQQEVNIATGVGGNLTSGTGDGGNHRGDANDYIKLMNPTNLTECCSAYTSLSFLVKPAAWRDDGVILFIGTPTSNQAAAELQPISSTSRLDRMADGTTGRSGAGESLLLAYSGGQNGVVPFASLRNISSTQPPTTTTISQPANSSSSGRRRRFSNQHLGPSVVVDGVSLAGTANKLAIGTSQLQDNNFRYTSRAAEFLAIEMRQRKLAVVQSLGSGIVEQIVDDFPLASSTWHRISVVRLGTLLTITVRTNQTSSSLTRSLVSPHTCLKLDPESSEIFVGGLPSPQFETTDGIASCEFEEESGGAVKRPTKLARAARPLTEIDSNRFPHRDGWLGGSSGNKCKHGNTKVSSSPPSSSSSPPLPPKPTGGLLESGLQGFAGQVADLSLNGQRLGLWNTAGKIVPPRPEAAGKYAATPSLVSSNGPNATTFTTKLPPPPQLPSESNAHTFTSDWLANVRATGNDDGQEIMMMMMINNAQPEPSPSACFLAPETGQIFGLQDGVGASGKEAADQVGLVSFARPRSNISSSFAQFLSSANNQLDDLLVENDVDIQSRLSHHDSRQPTTTLPISMAAAAAAGNGNGGHIRQLTLRFKTLSPDDDGGLLVHHTRPDHSSFLSIYITGGRLMLAFGADKKIRIGSHIVLSDGNWHSLNLIIGRLSAATRTGGNTTSASLPKERQFGRRIWHSIRVILDDKYMYTDRFSAFIESVGALRVLARVVMLGGEQVGKRKRFATGQSVGVGEPTFTATLKQEHQQVSGNSNNNLDGLQLTPPTTSITINARDSTSPNPNEAIHYTMDHHPNGHRNENNNQQHHSGTLNYNRRHQLMMRKLLYFGGVEDKYIPLLRNQQIPTNFHGCMADVTINSIRLNFAQTNKNQGVLMNRCHE